MQNEAVNSSQSEPINEQAHRADEKLLSRPLIIIFFTVFIDLLGFGIVLPLLPFFAEHFGATPIDVGFLMAIYSVMQFVFAPIWGSLSDRIGRRPVLFFSILGAAVGYLILGLAGSLWMLYAGRVLSGIMGGNISAAQAYIADITTPKNRARGMGLFGMAAGLGFVFGPALAGVLTRVSENTPFLFASGLSILNALSVALFLPESLNKNPDTGKKVSRSRLFLLRGALSGNRFSLITAEYLLVITAFSILTTAFAFYMGFSFGYGAEQTGYLLAFIGILSAFFQGVVFSALAKRWGEATLALIGAAAMAASLFIVPFVNAQNGGLTALLLGMGVFALGSALSNPSLTSLGSKTAPAEFQGSALGIIQSAGSLARVIGPVLCGFLLNNRSNQVDQATLTRTFLTAGCVMILAVLIALRFITLDAEK
ncbi:MAG TPA: MFS transporter [Pyrinomonadaceae bacterium]|nr:MFS transporter [Pyrinomonadaceae bacterium]